MTFAEGIDRLQRETAGCRALVFGDLSTRTVLRSPSAPGLRQEDHDALLAEAASCLGATAAGALAHAAGGTMQGATGGISRGDGGAGTAGAGAGAGAGATGAANRAAPDGPARAAAGGRTRGGADGIARGGTRRGHPGECEPEGQEAQGREPEGPDAQWREPKGHAPGGRQTGNDGGRDMAAPLAGALRLGADEIRLFRRVAPGASEVLCARLSPEADVAALDAALSDLLAAHA